MHPNSKKITVWGLLLLMAIPLFFTVGILVKQKILQYQREERLETELLQTVTISAERLFWVKPGKELIVEGKLFDVKSLKKEGENFLVTGFFDRREDRLAKDIKGLVQQKSGSHGQLAVKFLFPLVFTNHSEVSSEVNWKFISQQYYLFNETIPVAPVHSLNRPPRI